MKLTEKFEQIKKALENKDINSAISLCDLFNAPYKELQKKIEENPRNVPLAMTHVLKDLGVEHVQCDADDIPMSDEIVMALSQVNTVCGHIFHEFEISEEDNKILQNFVRSRLVEQISMVKQNHVPMMFAFNAYVALSTLKNVFVDNEKNVQMKPVAECTCGHTTDSIVVPPTDTVH